MLRFCVLVWSKRDVALLDIDEYVRYTYVYVHTVSRVSHSSRSNTAAIVVHRKNNSGSVCFGGILVCDFLHSLTGSLKSALSYVHCAYVQNRLAILSHMCAQALAREKRACKSVKRAANYSTRCSECVEYVFAWHMFALDTCYTARTDRASIGGVIPILCVCV